MDQNRGGGGLCGRGRRGAGPRGSEQDLESKGEVAARGSEVQAEAWPEFKGDLFRACRGVGGGRGVVGGAGRSVLSPEEEAQSSALCEGAA